jgi:hypothetical protein
MYDAVWRAVTLGCNCEKYILSGLKYSKRTFITSGSTSYRAQDLYEVMVIVRLC